MAAKKPIILNAEGRSLGRLAAEAAHFLRGKGSAEFEWQKLPAQRVVITNAARVRFTGRKLSQRSREQYSGYPGGLKKVPYQTLFSKNPTDFVRRAVAGMIPRNRLRKEILKHLTIYAREEQ